LPIRPTIRLGKATALPEKRLSIPNPRPIKDANGIPVTELVAEMDPEAQDDTDAPHEEWEEIPDIIDAHRENKKHLN
jgi:hypothetical protein